MVVKRRARSDSDKHQRREHILDTALALWEDRTFASFAMSEIATRSGLAKGTVYLYFQTKEELFLALLGRLLDAWFVDLNAALAITRDWDAESATTLFCTTLRQHHALTRLLPIAASILEHNIPLDAARTFKERLLEQATNSGARLEQCLPFLSAGDGLWLLLQVHALVVGLGQMADPAPIVQQVLADEAMAPLRVDFEQAFQRTMRALLRGLAS